MVGVIRPLKHYDVAFKKEAMEIVLIFRLFLTSSIWTKEERFSRVESSLQSW
jgi:hypothetical protein